MFTFTKFTCLVHLNKSINKVSMNIYNFYFKFDAKKYNYFCWLFFSTYFCYFQLISYKEFHLFLSIYLHAYKQNIYVTWFNYWFHISFIVKHCNCSFKMSFNSVYLFACFCFKIKMKRTENWPKINITLNLKGVYWRCSTRVNCVKLLKKNLYFITT